MKLIAGFKQYYSLGHITKGMLGIFRARIRLIIIPTVSVGVGLLLSCQAQLPQSGNPSLAAAPIITSELISESQSTSVSDHNATLTRQPPTVTPRPTITASPTAKATATDTPTPSATPKGSCETRKPGGDLLALVTLDYGLSRDYVPPDLVNLSDYFPTAVTLGYPTRARRIVVEPLVRMIGDMQSEALNPQIISGYRSYSAQAIAWSKWREEVPETASIVSAPPGHSEHQLGTTFDFGSPELPEIVGEEDIEFHTYFYLTSEGQWLLEHAHEYGFTLSYTREAFEISGLFYEPWHYRFVGAELAIQLKEQNISLIEFLLEKQDPPCIP